MDTELNYKYKDGFHSDVKEGHITLDKGIFKSYAGRYETDIKDNVKDSLARRLWNCKLIWEGDIDCKRFLSDLKEFCNGSYEEDDMNNLHEWLMKQELIEIRFECY